jgi:2-amino-4-hydroxy-6-hydroxymethyldihydropteridine diphosphokinase
MQRICWIALGSNLNNPKQQVQAAIELLKVDSRWQVTGVSRLYETTPLGPAQANYINGVVRIACNLLPIDLCRSLLAIEEAQGRVRDGKRWESRVLDLDLLLCAEERVDTDELTLPHPGLLVRAFVLKPMHDIEANFVLPNGRTVAQQLLEIGEKV